MPNKFGYSVSSREDDIQSALVLKVMDSVDVMLGYWGADLHCQFANAAYRKWFGKSRHDLIGITMQELLGPLFQLNFPYVQRVLAGETPVFERAIQLPDGTIRHSLASYYPDFSADGSVVGFIAQVTDVSRLKLLEIELKSAKADAEALATHDFLTGLPNRVLLTDRLVSGIDEAKLHSAVAGVVLIDLDNFKALNDTHGHQLGDQYLKAVATRLRESIRETDTVMRFGGDEFILLANNMESRRAVELLVERMMKEVQRELRIDDVVTQPSLSCGIATYPANGADAEMLIRAADSALYDVKRKGGHGFSISASG